MLRLLILLATLALVLATSVACGGGDATQPPATAEPQAADTPAPPTPDDETQAMQEEPTQAPRLTAADIPPCDGRRGGGVGDCAPEFAGTQGWINSDPLTMDSLRGQVVLIDFWTYTCVNCIRTLPFLREWHDRYSEEGLVIIGVHTPEFEFEKIYDNVVDSTVEEGVVWPVVQDNDFRVWRSYSNRFWPAKYLIDQTGKIRYSHFGEGKYGETEEMIRSLLEEGGMASAEGMPLPDDQARDQTFMQRGTDVTRELFAGWKFSVVQGRGGFGQGEEYLQASAASYDTEDEAPVVAQFVAPESLQRNVIYFHGPWAIGPESARHAQESDNYDDYITLKYSARSVNAVLTSDSGVNYQVLVTINDEYLTEDNRGADVIIDDDGVSYIEVTTPKLYKLVEHPTWEASQVLRLSSLSDDFGLFSFTFGVYEDGF